MLEKVTGAGGRGVGLVVVAAAVTSEVAPRVDERERRIVTTSDVPVFARSERNGKLSGRSGPEHVLSRKHLCASVVRVGTRMATL